MNRWLVAAVAAAVLLVIGLPTAALTLDPGSSGGPVKAAVAQSDQTAPPSPPATAEESAGEPDEADEAEAGDDEAEADDADRSTAHPPKAKGERRPSWAGAGKGHEAKAGWKQAWKKLTPEQRSARMAKLAREHAEGMKQWTACTNEGRDDCVKPLPPGLAKKR